MADSWEDQDDQPDTKGKGGFSFNPNASKFSFSPGAKSFGGPAPAPPAGASSSGSAPPELTPEEKAAQAFAADIAAEVAAMKQMAMNAPSPTVKVSSPTPVAPKEDPAPAPTAPGASQQTRAQAKAEEKAEKAAAQADGVEIVDENEKKRILEILAKEDLRPHMNVVFIGHVDAGKSTLGGQILCLMGGVDERTMEKYKETAKENNRESWYMAYVMDTNDEERAKGKTVEVGRAHFSTDKKRYTILDAPGHKNYVPDMIQGAAQADIGVLVISARKGEFETGYERGGQTREHAQLAKTLGVTKLVVVINKMDDPSVSDDGKWNKERYDEIVGKLTPFLRTCGYNPKTDIAFCPIAALHGHNVLKSATSETCDWYKGETLFSLLDAVEPLNRNPAMPFRMPIIDKYKDMGTVVMGKSESGAVVLGQSMYIMPNNVKVKVSNIWRDDEEVNAAGPGENLKVRLGGIDEEQVSLGFVLSGPTDRCPVVTKFECILSLLELLDHKSIFSAGYKSILHLHALTEECEVVAVISQMDKKTRTSKKCSYVKSGATVTCRISTDKPICAEAFDKNPQMGRFTLRDEGRTIAIGKVTKLPPSSKPTTK